MPLKLTKTDERVVFLGKTAEEIPWGFVQFPRFLETPEGDIGLYVHNEDDNPHFLGCVILYRKTAAKLFRRQPRNKKRAWVRFYQAATFSILNYTGLKNSKGSKNIVGVSAITIFLPTVCV